MSKVDKQALRELAEKAWSGDWYESGELYYHDDRSGEAHRLHSDEDGFIVAVCPATVLALLDDLHSAESRLHEVATACATAEQERDQLREVAMRLIDLQNSGRGPIRTFTLWNDVANRARQVLGLEVRNG